MRVVAWMTDDAVTFLCNFMAERRKIGRLPAVLEFGTGASTLFFASRASKVIGFEHDIGWHARTEAHLEIEGATHVTLHRLDRPYSDRVADLAKGQKFDIVSVDGRDRVSCLEQVLKHNCVESDGILVIDNTERLAHRYSPMLNMLRDDFQYIHFEQQGMDRAGWNPNHRWMTTIAWRKDSPQYTTRGLLLQGGRG